MAVYSAVTAGEKDPESPIDVNLISKLDQNPLAIAEGASGAPKIQPAAFADEAVNFEKLINADYTTDTDHTLGSGTGSVTGGAYVKVDTVIAPVNGQFNIRIGLKSDSSPSAGFARAYKNGVAFGTERTTTSSTYVYWDEDLACTANDKIQLYVSGAGGGLSATGYIALVATNAPAAASAGS